MEIDSRYSNQIGLSVDRLRRQVESAEDAGETGVRVLLVAPGFTGSVRSAEDVQETLDRLKKLGMSIRVFPEEYLPHGRRPMAADRHLGDRAAAAFQFFRRLFHSLMAFEVLYLCHFAGSSLLTAIAPTILLAKFLGKRVVLDYRSTVPLNRVGNRTFLYQRLWKLCDRVLIPSPYQRQLVNSFGGRAEYLPPAVPPSDISARVIREVQPRILVATELEREHGVACAIRAYRMVKHKYPRTELVVVGSGSQRTALERMVTSEKIPGVIFTGDVTREQRHGFYEKSDLFVSCSTVDYLSVGTVEAFAFGLPVLTTPITGIADVLRGSGNVLLLSYNDHVDLANKIIRLIEEPDLTEQLSRSARAMAERYSSWAAHQRSRGLYRRRQA